MTAPMPLLEAKMAEQTAQLLEGNTGIRSTAEDTGDKILVFRHPA